MDNKINIVLFKLVTLYMTVIAFRHCRGIYAGFNSADN